MIAGMLACSLAAGMTLVEEPDGFMAEHYSTTLASSPDLGPVARFTTRSPLVRDGSGPSTGDRSIPLADGPTTSTGTAPLDEEAGRSGLHDTLLDALDSTTPLSCFSRVIAEDDDEDEQENVVEFPSVEFPPIPVSKTRFVPDGSISVEATDISAAFTNVPFSSEQLMEYDDFSDSSSVTTYSGMPELDIIEETVATPVPQLVADRGDEFIELWVDPDLIFEQQWFVPHRVHNRLMHAIHGNTTTTKKTSAVKTTTTEDADPDPQKKTTKKSPAPPNPKPPVTKPAAKGRSMLTSTRVEELH